MLYKKKTKAINATQGFKKHSATSDVKVSNSSHS